MLRGCAMRVARSLLGAAAIATLACRGAPGPAFCPDGVVQLGEGCDDGNIVNGDGCSAGCDEEPGFECSGSPSVCVAPGGCPPGANEVEPNDSIAEAGSADLDVTGRLCPGDVDYWSIELAPLENVTVDVVWSTSAGSLSVALVDSSDNMFDYSGDAGGYVCLSYTSALGETIYVVVRDEVGRTVSDTGAPWVSPGPNGIAYDIF